MVLGPLIGAAGSLLGGVLGANRADDAADQAWDRTKKMATHQIQWKVQDAIAAGLHPLAGLGVNPMSTPAASVGGEILGQGIADMGQNLGRAAEAYMTPQDKSASRMLELQMERGTLENDLLRTQIASQRMRNMQQATPGLPGPPIVAPSSPGGGEKLAGLPGDWKISNPGLGQRMEDAYSEWSNVVLLPNFLNDAAKYLGLERLLTSMPNPWQLGSQHGQALRENIIKGWKGTPGGGSGW